MKLGVYKATRAKQKKMRDGFLRRRLTTIDEEYDANDDEPDDDDPGEDPDDKRSSEDVTVIKFTIGAAKAVQKGKEDKDFASGAILQRSPLNEAKDWRTMTVPKRRTKTQHRGRACNGHP